LDERWWGHPEVVRPLYVFKIVGGFQALKAQNINTVWLTGIWEEAPGLAL